MNDTVFGLIRHDGETPEHRFKESYLYWRRVAEDERSTFAEIELAWKAYVAARELFLFGNFKAPYKNYYF